MHEDEASEAKARLAQLLDEVNRARPMTLDRQPAGAARAQRVNLIGERWQ
jgi:hypothetical protein